MILSITTCKRLELFRKTIQSLSNSCMDLHLITDVYHFDDSSSAEDRIEMERILRECLGDVNIRNYRFEKETIPTQYRHSWIMNQWLYNIPGDRVMHIEDDWLFERDFRITECLELLDSDDSIGLVGVSQPLREAPIEFEFKLRGNFWKWYFDETRPVNDLLFMDYVEMRASGIEGFWCKYINWPYFSLRPGVFAMDRVRTIGRFQEDYGFELEFSERFAKKYVSYCHRERICRHIGEVSSYEINSSSR